MGIELSLGRESDRVGEGVGWIFLLFVCFSSNFLEKLCMHFFDKYILKVKK